MHEYTHLLILAPYTFFQGEMYLGKKGRGGGYKDEKERNVWSIIKISRGVGVLMFFLELIKFYTIRLYYIDSVFK